jgi:RHS repeat-associated protein
VGYYTDPNAGGLILCGQRWYDPVIGRWLNRDPIEYDGGLNLYGYCGDNPDGGLDPSGDSLKHKKTIIVAGVILGALSGLGPGHTQGAKPVAIPAPAAKLGEKELEGKGPGKAGAGSGPGGGKPKECTAVNLSHTAGNAAKATVATVVIWAVWEGGKWVVATLAAPETGGATWILAAGTP